MMLVSHWGIYDLRGEGEPSKAQVETKTRVIRNKCAWW